MGTATHPTMHLGEGETVEALAGRVRRAYLEFLELPPGKAALGRWLMTSYRACTFRPPRPSGVSARQEEPPASTPDHVAEHELHESRVDEVITQARGAVLAAIEAVAMPRPSFDRFPAVSALVPVADATGRRGWLAVDRPHLKLRDRVLALVAADVMMQPEDFRTGHIHVCHLCENIYFGETCWRHASGVRKAHDAPSKNVGT